MTTVSQVWTNNFQALRRCRQYLDFRPSLSRFLQLRFNLFLFRFLPISFIKGYMWAMSRLYFICSQGQASTIKRNMAVALRDRTPSEVEEIFRGVIRGIVRHYQEKIYNGFFDTPDLREFLISRVSLCKPLVSLFSPLA